MAAGRWSAGRKMTTTRTTGKKRAIGDAFYRLGLHSTPKAVAHAFWQHRIQYDEPPAPSAARHVAPLDSRRGQDVARPRADRHRGSWLSEHGGVAGRSVASHVVDESSSRCGGPAVVWRCGRWD